MKFFRGEVKAPETTIWAKVFPKEFGHRLGEFGYLVACVGLDPSSLAPLAPLVAGFNKMPWIGYIYRSLRQRKKKHVKHKFVVKFLGQVDFEVIGNFTLSCGIVIFEVLNTLVFPWLITSDTSHDCNIC